MAIVHIANRRFQRLGRVELFGFTVAFPARLEHHSRAMPTRRRFLILPLLLLPSLLGCGSVDTPKGPPPLSAQANAAVVEKPGAARSALVRKIDALFTDEQAGETHALLIMYGGKIVAQRYAPGFDGNTRFLGWSMSQCVTGLMVGLLVSDGRLRLNESAPVPTWRRSGDPRGEITLRQLLQMRSGLRHDETARKMHEADAVRMLFLDGRDDMATYAEAQPLEAEPGREFEYSSATPLILSDLAARTLTESSKPDQRRRAVLTYLRTRLFEPAGLDSMVPEFDASGTLIGSTMIHANAEDWARLGEFLRHHGSVAGAQILPRRWIEFMISPSPRNPAYGAQVWLNRTDPNGAAPLFPKQVPESAFGCIGQLGQYLIVSPRQKLSLVRLGHTDAERLPALKRHLAEIATLFPGS